MKIIGSLSTWYFWAYYATGLFIMASVMLLYVRLTPMPGRGPRLIVVGAYLGALGAFIGGLQAGRYPPMQAALGVAVIRACWVTGITLGIVASGLYLWRLRGGKQ